MADWLLLLLLVIFADRKRFITRHADSDEPPEGTPVNTVTSQATPSSTSRAHINGHVTSSQYSTYNIENQSSPAFSQPYSLVRPTSALRLSKNSPPLAIRPTPLLHCCCCWRRPMMSASLLPVAEMLHLSALYASCPG